MRTITIRKAYYNVYYIVTSNIIIFQVHINNTCPDILFLVGMDEMERILQARQEFLVKLIYCSEFHYQFMTKIHFV